MITAASGRSEDEDGESIFTASVSGGSKKKKSPIKSARWDGTVTGERSQHDRTCPPSSAELLQVSYSHRGDKINEVKDNLHQVPDKRDRILIWTGCSADSDNLMYMEFSIPMLVKGNKGALMPLTSCCQVNRKMKSRNQNKVLSINKDTCQRSKIFT